MAAIDFPASPILGQIFVAAGINYQWNGQGWLVVPYDLTGPGAGFVAKTGDTMTGDLAIDKVDPTIILDKSLSGEVSALEGKMNGQLRWRLLLGDTEAESGAAVGSDFRLQAYSNAGVLIGSPIIIDRATGLMLLAGPPTDPLGAVTKAYADAIAGLQAATAAEVRAAALATKAVSPLTHQAAHTPAFKGVRGTAMSVGLSSTTAVVGMTETLDTDNCFNGTRFTPNVPGWYEIGGQIAMPTSGDNYSFIGISMNAIATLHWWQMQTRAATPQSITLQVKGLIHFNGAGDYVELIGQSDYAPGPQFASAHFWGNRVIAP